MKVAPSPSATSEGVVSAPSIYPFTGDVPFVFNAWYVAAWSSEVTGTPIARTLLGQSLVLYRQTNGRPVVLANRCPHRGLPLAMGTVDGDDIACGYHGLVYDPLGRCRRIPSQERVPPGIAVRHYPAVERWQWIWVWMGDAEMADDALIPDSEELGLAGPPWHADPGADYMIRSRFQLFNENLLDQTHLTFVHGETIGSSGILGAGMQVNADGRRVWLTRETQAEQMSPFYARRFGVEEGQLMDREWILTFIAPAFHIVHTRVLKAGTRSQPQPVVFGEHKILHAITPETSTTLHDFWAMTRTYNPSEEMTLFLRENLDKIIKQDVTVLEAVEARLHDTPAIVEYSVAADAAALRARRVVQELLNAERR